MTNHAIPGLFLLFALTATAQAFEPFDYKKVPTPGIDQRKNARFEPLVETLTGIASNDNIPEINRAKLLAAARAISPLNKNAFYTEYLLSIGDKPGEIPPIPEDRVPDVLEPYLKELGTLLGAGEFITFVNEATKFDPSAPPRLSNSSDPFADESDSVPATESSVNTCGLLTMEGCREITCRSSIISGKTFKFRPAELNSEYFMSAFRESLKYIALTGTEGLIGRQVDFLTDAELTDEEGPSGALACAVLTEAVAGNFKVDSLVAFSGDVNADGTVQPLDDQKERLTASPDSLYHVVVIPKADRYSLDDILLLHGPAIFYTTQIFEVGTLNQAVEIGKKTRPENINQSLKTFYQVQQVLKQPDGRKYLRNSHVKKRLSEVIKLTPNHLSAQQLIKVSKGIYPRHLSLQASFEIVFEALKPVIEDDGIDQYGKLDPEGFEKLKRYRDRLDPSLEKLAGATFSFETSGRIGTDSGNERARVTQNLKEELNAVSRNVRIRERMM